MPIQRLQLVLSAKRKSWRLADGHASEADNAFVSVRNDVLSRDDYHCQGCGFRAERWQEVHHKDDDHANNNPSNLATVCCLCHQVFHLGMTGMRRSGIIIWCPEIDQANINNISRAIFVAVMNKKTHEEPAR